MVKVKSETKNSSTIHSLRSGQGSGQAPLGVTQTPTEQNLILQKLSTIEDLLKGRDDHAYRQTSKPLTFKEACAYLGYAPSYLYKLTYRKIIPHYKPTGKMIFFSKAEIDGWIFKSRNQNSEDSSQNNETETTNVNDPNQIEMELDGKSQDVKGEKEGEKTEIIIEFPLKSRRGK